MIVYSIFVIVGILLLIAAVAALKRSLRFVRAGERAEGIVVRVAEVEDADGNLYYPVFEIPTQAHGTITYRHGTSSSPANWEVGDKAVFIFDPARPESVTFLRYWRVFGWPLSLMAVAVDLLVVGGGYFLLRGYFGG